MTGSVYFCKLSRWNRSIMRWSAPLNSTAWKQVHCPPWFDITLILQNWEDDVKPVNFWGTPTKGILIPLKMIDFYLICVYALVSTLAFQDLTILYVSLFRDVKLQICWLVILLEILICKHLSDCTKMLKTSTKDNSFSYLDLWHFGCLS